MKKSIGIPNSFFVSFFFFLGFSVNYEMVFIVLKIVMGEESSFLFLLTSFLQKSPKHISDLVQMYLLTLL
jgi:hypothetical protein